MKKSIKKFTLFTLFSLYILFPFVTTGQIIHVPGDYSLIQEAIDAANDNDTVLVADETYTENINFMGKAIPPPTAFAPDTWLLMILLWMILAPA